MKSLTQQLEKQEDPFFKTSITQTCQQIFRTFWNRKVDHLHEYLDKCQTLYLATLGPPGTSSEATAGYLLQQLTGTKDGSYCLYPSYEESAQSLLDGRTNLLLVANAYQRIDQIYMNPQITPLFAFLHPTPDYGIARKKDNASLNLKRKVKIATHHAPSSLMQYLIRDWGLNYKMILADSTSKAAIDVQQGRADLCMTNATSVEKYGLEFISPTRPIYMLWSLFGQLTEGKTQLF